MALWLIVAWLVVADVVVGVVGVKRKSGTMMIASGAWALFFVGCGFVVNFVRCVRPVRVPLDRCVRGDDVRPGVEDAVSTGGVSAWVENPPYALCLSWN